MPSVKSSKRAGFFCELPIATIKLIRRRTTATKPQWLVIYEAINNIKVKNGVVKKKAATEKRSKNR